MKKLLTLLAILGLGFSLAACDGEETETPETPEVNCTETPEHEDCEVECEAGQEYSEELEECVAIVIPDTEAPVITVPADLEYTIGEDAPDYSVGVSATDNEDSVEAIVLDVDSSLVDLTTVGTYEITVTATDTAGNESTETYNIIVEEYVMTNEDLAKLDISMLNVTLEDLNLPTFTSNGSFIFWGTSHPDVLTNRGFVTPPPVGSDPVVVTLTATVKNGSYTEVVEFTLNVDPWAEVSVTSKVMLPYTGTSEEYVTVDDPEVAVYYVDNGTVPYMDIEEFITMLDGAIDSTILTYTPIGEDQLEISYSAEYEDFDGTIVTETFTALIDFTENTFEVNNWGFFGSYVADTESDYGEGLTYVDAEYVDPTSVMIPLGDYNFDIVVYDDGGETKYLMPFHVNNLMFLGDMYFDAYYNGDEIRGFSYLLDDPESDYMDPLKTSSLTGTTMEDDMRWATVNYMALMFDFWYGLKEDHGVESYIPFMNNRAQDYLEGSVSNLYRNIFDFIYEQDDLHTSHSYPGYFLSPYELGLSLSDLGPRTTSFYEDGIWAMQDLLEAKYGSVEAMPDYELIDNNKTAVIHLTGFSIDTPDEFKAIMDSLPAETENVVIDLSYNTGGNLGAVLRIFGYMTEERFAYHSQNPADGSAYTLWIESDYVAYDYNWYIMTSKVTFSAANLMASMAKEQGIATVIGQPSSGGASSIGHFNTPDGSGVIISTNNVLSTRVGNEIDGYEYLSIEYGITPEISMQDVTSDSELIALIEQHQAE